MQLERKSTIQESVGECLNPLGLQLSYKSSSCTSALIKEAEGADAVCYCLSKPLFLFFFGSPFQDCHTTLKKSPEFQHVTM